MATATLCPPCATMMREMREKLVPAVAARFDAARHWAGYVVLAGTFYVLPCWLSIHPLAALWRRLGRVFTLAFHASLVVALVANGARPEYREETMRWGGGDLGPPSGFASASPQRSSRSRPTSGSRGRARWTFSPRAGSEASSSAAGGKEGCGRPACTRS